MPLKLLSALLRHRSSYRIVASSYPPGEQEPEEPEEPWVREMEDQDPASSTADHEFVRDWSRVV
jgi:hypothetical protein